MMEISPNVFKNPDLETSSINGYQVIIPRRAAAKFAIIAEISIAHPIRNIFNIE